MTINSALLDDETIILNTESVFDFNQQQVSHQDIDYCDNDDNLSSHDSESDTRMALYQQLSQKRHDAGNPS